MPKQTTISISNARSKIFEIAEAVQTPGHYFTLTENGKAKATIMSAEEHESWLETMEVMRIFPDLDKDIIRAERDYKKGDYITLDDLLAKDGWILADKPRKQRTYAVSRRPAKKSPKRLNKN